MAATQLGFLKSSNDLASGIFIPKYYDPTINVALEKLKSTHSLVELGSLIDSGQISVHPGHDIGKHHYGMGNIPYVRTSDIATWEIVSAPKQTVGTEAYEIYAPRQDVRVGDVLFVRDGLYLIGRTAYITEYDLPLIHQSHLIRLRPALDAAISSAFLMAVLSTPIVIRQVRAKQFTAGIIDKIEDRYRELILPIPSDQGRVQAVSQAAYSLIMQRAQLREKLKRIPLFAQGLIAGLDSEVIDLPANQMNGNLGYLLPSGSITSSILIPKYYDPRITSTLEEMREGFELRTIGDMVKDGTLSIATGLEVGKLAYGLGEIPFIRTSDLADWELSGQPKHRISSELFEALRDRANLRAGDILLVRDGTYLVGTSAILTEADAKAIYAGGLYRIRVNKPEDVDPYLLLSLLNMPVVKQQIRARQFTRDIIDTLGLRLYEIVVPIPKPKHLQREIAAAAREVVDERARLRDRAKAIVLDIAREVSELGDGSDFSDELPL
jgi:hypothetical protein